MSTDTGRFRAIVDGHAIDLKTLKETIETLASREPATVSDLNGLERRLEGKMDVMGKGIDLKLDAMCTSLRSDVSAVEKRLREHASSLSAHRRTDISKS